jgi:hypothetical protein
MVGFTGPLLIMLIIFCISFGYLSTDNTRLINILPVYRATGLPIIFIWIWAVLIIAWQRHGINYVYILQLKPDSIATYMDILKIASFFTMLWLSSFILFLGMENDWFTIFKHEHFPSSMPALILVVIMIIATLFPFNIFYRETRIGMLFSLWNILISPVGRLYFRDFFLADILTSLPSALVDVAYSACFFATSQFLAKGEGGVHTYSGQCNQYNTLYFATLFAFLPYWWRFMQCLNKYYYTRHAWPHLVNAGKYFSGLVVVAFTVAHSLGDPKSKANTPTALYLLLIALHLFNAVYSWIWDVYMDWGLARSRKNPLLRRKLLCKPICSYYAIITGDIILRLFWIVSIFSFIFMNSAFWNPISAVVEIFRRGVWAFFRVELEALENYEEYQTIDIRAPKLLMTESKQNFKSVSVRDYNQIQQQIRPLHSLRINPSYYSFTKKDLPKSITPYSGIELNYNSENLDSSTDQSSRSFSEFTTILKSDE